MFGVSTWPKATSLRDGNRIELTMEGLLRVDGLLPAFFEDENRGVRYT